MKNLSLIMLLLIEISCVTTKKYNSSTNTIPSEQVTSDAPDSSVTTPPARFHTEVKYTWVKEVVATANCVLHHKKFIEAVEAVDLFDYSDKNGKQVIADLHKSNCGIRTYKTKNIWSKVLATTYSSDREYFYFNTRKNPRELKYMVNTAIHECLHLVGYGHGNNSSVGKQNSVPYGVGSMAEEVVEFCNQ